VTVGSPRGLATLDNILSVLKVASCFEWSAPNSIETLQRSKGGGNKASLSGG